MHLDRWRETIGNLPGVYIQDVELPDDHSEEPENTEDHDRQQLHELLQDMQGRVKDISEQDRAGLSALSMTLSTLSNQLVNVETIIGERVEVLQSRIDRLAHTVNILLWFAGAILLFMLFK